MYEDKWTKENQDNENTGLDGENGLDRKETENENQENEGRRVVYGQLGQSGQGDQGQAAGYGQQSQSGQGQSTGYGQQSQSSQGQSMGYGQQSQSNQGQTTGYGQQSQSNQGQSTGYGQQSGQSNQGQSTGYGQQSQGNQGQSTGYGQQNQSGQSSQGQPTGYGQQNQGRPGYQGQTYGRPYGQQSYNQQPYNQQGRPGYGQQPYGTPGQNHFGGPYQYNGYQNSQMNQNQNPNQAGGQSHKNPKKRSGVKTVALVTAAALLFGVVSGGTMFGVNRAAEYLFPAETEAPAVEETLPQTSVAPAAPQASTENTGGVVIEDVSPIVSEVMPSVVSITNTTIYQSTPWFGQPQTYEVPSSGSGIIVGQNDTELLVVTNNHVIEGADSLSVTFIDQSTVDAAVKGADSESDLAVIAIPLENISADTKAQIKTATLGDSDSLKMGQGVIAIGNALGLGQSVTVGHVSALDREITVDGITKKVIQTDAAINPGNSGGALLNSKGEVIGINEAKYANENVEGVGYAIPISYAKDIIEDLKLRTTKIEVAEEDQGYLGIQVQNINSTTAQAYAMPEGVYVYKITEDSAAAESDLRERDIITKFDGETVRTYADLTRLLTYYKAGSKVKLTVQSLENGQYVEREVEVTLKNRPVEEEQK